MFDLAQISEAIIHHLPLGTTVTDAVLHGKSSSAETIKVTTTLVGESTKNYFLKCVREEYGKVMMRGEFESMTAIYALTPNFCPRPIAWGLYSAHPLTYFFLSDFHEMGRSPPEPVAFCNALNLLYERGTSPNGKFGFHVTTCNGSIPQHNLWADTWEQYFSIGMRHMINLDKDVNGLLGPLLGEIPKLVHGDLWFENTATSECGAPIVFDSCAFYGHWEYDLGNWLPRRNNLLSYISTFTQRFAVSEPKEDFDDRIALYSTRFNLHASISSKQPQFRLMVIKEIRKLIDKYKPLNE